MPALSAVSTSKEETIAITKNQLSELQCAWSALSALELVLSHSVDGSYSNCGSLVRLIEEKMSSVFEEI